MDISVEKQSSSFNKSNSDSPAARFLFESLKKVFSFFSLSEEEKIQAGINLGEYEENLVEVKTIDESPPSIVVSKKGRIA